MNILINKIPKPLPDNTPVALDVELFGAVKHKLHRPTGKFACLSICYDDNNVYLTTDENLVDIALGRIDNCEWGFHFAQFDLRQLRRWSDISPRKKLWCSYIIERLLWSGFYDRFSEKDLARRYLDFYLEKGTRDLFSTANELNEDTIHYAATDAITLWKIIQTQKEFVKDRKDVQKIWKKVDRDAIWAYLDFGGIRLDVDQWESLAKENKEKADHLKKEIQDEFGFLPSSPKQVKGALWSAGWKVRDTQEKTLRKWIDKKSTSKPASMALATLHFRKYATLSSRYGMNVIKNHVEDEDGCQIIYSNFSVTGASSGRNASSNPNMQNIPIKEHPIFRQPWIARPGNKLIVADWSAQEARIHAYLTQDKTLKKIFKKDKDVYTKAYNLMYDAKITKDDPLRSDIGKPAFLAATYGQSPQGAAEKYGMTVDEAEDMQSRFWRAFPDSSRWCSHQKHQKNYVESVMGRRLWVNKHNDQHERNNLNHPHQATAADMMKRTVSKIHQGWDYDYPFAVVAVVHDELILDVPEELAPEIAEFVSTTMIEVAEDMCKGIPFKADAVICDNWLEAKQK